MTSRGEIRRKNGPSPLVLTVFAKDRGDGLQNLFDGDGVRLPEVALLLCLAEVTNRFPEVVFGFVIVFPGHCDQRRT